jgi:hypothetical protein
MSGMGVVKNEAYARAVASTRARDTQIAAGAKEAR